MSIGKKEIQDALNNIELSNDKYSQEEIEKSILNYFNNKEDETLEFPTFRSGEFGDLDEMYKYLKEVMLTKGYYISNNNFILKKDNI